MSTKQKVQAAQAVADEALLRANKSASGTSAFSALANNAQVAVSGPPPAPAVSGTAMTLSFTPRVSGKVLVMAYCSGVQSSGEDHTSFSLDAGVAGNVTADIGAGRDPSFHMGVSLMKLFSGMVVGVPVTLTLSWTTFGGGTFGPAAGKGTLTAIELPA